VNTNFTQSRTNPNKNTGLRKITGLQIQSKWEKGVASTTSPQTLPVDPSISPGDVAQKISSLLIGDSSRFEAKLQNQIRIGRNKKRTQV
jgi:hypothetical protein